MKERILDDLIDNWLKHKISEEDRIRLERMMEADPVFVTRIRETRETYRFLQYLKYKEIRDRLREYDKYENAKLSAGNSGRWKLAAIILLAVFLGTWMWMIDHFNPVNLAKRNFESRIAIDMIDEPVSNSEDLLWKQADKYFQEHDFKSAADLYQFFEENTGGLYYHYARWNKLLCQLATEGPTENLMEELNRFYSIAPEEAKSKAIRLSRLLESKFYKWGILKPSSQFSALKPRLI